MCAEKKNDKKEKNISGCCCDGMAEMMGSFFPKGEINSDCCAWMKKMNEKFCCPKSSDSAKEENWDCCSYPFGGSPTN